MNRKRYRKIAAAVLGLAMTLAAGTGIYAIEDGTYHDFRDGDISLYLPEGWASLEEAPGESEGMEYEKILHAEDGISWGSGLSLDVYFMSDEVASDDYIYFDNDEAGALDYYDHYGEEAVDNLCSGALTWPEGVAESQWETSYPVFFDGEWNGFLVTNISGSAEMESGETKSLAYTIYLTAKMANDSKTVVHNILVFYNDESTALTDDQAQLVKEIADEFYDYNYANEMLGITTDGYEWDEDDDSGSDGLDDVLDVVLGILGILAPLIAVASVVVIIVRRAKKRVEERTRSAAAAVRKSFGEITDAQRTFQPEDTFAKWKKRRAQKTSFSGREQRSEQRSGRRQERRAERRSTMQMRSREAESAEKRYYESLQTLHKSGLLTKDEMKDMLERHERSRFRHRNQRRT